MEPFENSHSCHPRGTALHALQLCTGFIHRITTGHTITTTKYAVNECLLLQGRSTAFKGEKGEPQLLSTSCELSPGLEVSTSVLFHKPRKPMESLPPLASPCSQFYSKYPLGLSFTVLKLISHQPKHMSLYL